MSKINDLIDYNTSRVKGELSEKRKNGNKKD